MALTKITSSELEELISSGRRFVAIFSTSWCGFCRSLVKEIERKAGGCEVAVVDISDDSDPAWEKYNIDMVPTALLFNGGREVARKSPRWDGLGFTDIRELLEQA